MGACRLRIATVSFHFHGVDEIRKFDCVLDEEDWNVVAYEVPVSLLGIEFDGKTSHIARCIDGTRTAGNG